MPLTAAERDEVLAEIARCLDTDIHTELMTYLAQAVSLTETYPEQVNNELRNVTTHFARALCADNLADAKADLAKASGHIDRAKRDCLKISIITIHDRVHHICAQIKASSGTLEPAFVVRRTELAKHRDKILRAEINGATGVANSLLDFLADLEALDADLTREYHIGSKLVSRTKLFLLRMKSYAIGFGVGVISAIVFGVIFAFVVPHPENIRRDALQAIKPPAANTPSTDATPTPPAQPR